MSGIGNIVHFCFLGQQGTKVDGFCHIDVLVCGPTSVSEETEGENCFDIFFFKAIDHIYKCGRVHGRVAW